MSLTCEYLDLFTTAGTNALLGDVINSDAWPVAVVESARVVVLFGLNCKVCLGVGLK